MEEGARPALLNNTWGEVCASQLLSVLVTSGGLPVGTEKTLEQLAILKLEPSPPVITGREITHLATNRPMRPSMRIGLD